jgi:hypothetical protein
MDVSNLRSTTDSAGIRTTTSEGIGPAQSSQQQQSGDPLLEFLIRSRAPKTPVSNLGDVGAAVEKRSYAPQMSSGGYSPEMATQPAKQAPQRVTRMRALAPNQDPSYLNHAVPSLIKMPNTQVEEYQLPDGSWSLDAVYGTLAGNEAAVQAINNQRGMNPTSILPMNLSGGLSVLAPQRTDKK